MKREIASWKKAVLWDLRGKNVHVFACVRVYVSVFYREGQWCFSQHEDILQRITKHENFLQGKPGNQSMHLSMQSNDKLTAACMSFKSVFNAFLSGVTCYIFYANLCRVRSMARLTCEGSPGHKWAAEPLLTPYSCCTLCMCNVLCAGIQLLFGKFHCFVQEHCGGCPADPTKALCCFWANFLLTQEHQTRVHHAAPLN